MTMKPACPDPLEYRQLISGLSPEADQEALLSHLEGCDDCAGGLAALPEQDTLVELVRQARTLPGALAPGTVARLVERLSRLRPPETPSSQLTTMPDPVVSFTCSACDKKLKVKATLAGKEVRCPACQRPVDVPALQETAPRPVGPPAYRTADRRLYDFLAPARTPGELGRLGSYRVLSVLGAGGMGVVFLAEDTHLERGVALKVMLPGLAATETARQRFLREARAAAAVKHDHIVTIYQVGEDRGVPFLAMELLAGEALDARLVREGRVSVPEVLRIGREVALGLAAAHDKGLIHRDIKPPNVWLEAATGRVKVLDFGLARAVAEGAHLTQSGAIVGTPAFMAPEQAQGKTVDARADLFSLGCVLYLMATGERPFGGTDIMSVLFAVATETPRPAIEVNTDLPGGLSKLIQRLLAKEPEGRPESAQAVAAELERIGREPAPALRAARNGKPAQKPPAPRGPRPRSCFGRGGTRTQPLVVEHRRSSSVPIK